MAIYHLHIKNLSRRDGRSAVAAAAYRAGQLLRNDFEDKDSDFSGRTGVVHEEILAPENAPDWVRNREALWNKVEAAEKRKDARLAKEVEIALPRELPRALQIELLRTFAEEFKANKLVVDLTIHDIDDGNPHAHMLLTTRPLTGEGFGKKDRKLDSVAFVNATRERWSRLVNAHLAGSGSNARVDHRTLAAQGIARKPDNHRGVDRAERLKKRIASHDARPIPNSTSSREEPMRLIYEQLVRTQNELDEWEERQVANDEQDTKRKLVDDLKHKREDLLGKVERDEIDNDKTLKEVTRRELLERWDDAYERGLVRDAYNNPHLSDEAKPSREDYDRTFERDPRTNVSLAEISLEQRREEIQKRTRLDELQADLTDVDRAIAQTQEARFVSQDKRDARLTELMQKAVDIRSEQGQISNYDRAPQPARNDGNHQRSLDERERNMDNSMNRDDTRDQGR